MTKSEAGTKGGGSKSAAKSAASSRNLAAARAKRKELAKLPAATRWLLAIFNHKEPSEEDFKEALTDLAAKASK